MPWPNRPSGAFWYRITVNGEVLGEHWAHGGLPPEPWPTDEPDGTYPVEKYGPPGTAWGPFTGSAVLARLAGTASGWRKVAYWLRKTGARTADGVGTFVVPEDAAAPAEAVYEEELPMPMTWIRTQIVGQVGTDEETVHTLNWRHSSQENAPLDATIVKDVGNAVRDAWAAYVNACKGMLPAVLLYTEVRASELYQAAPGERPEWRGSTQVSPFAPGIVRGSEANPLPYQIAHCISMNTNFRGTSRFRGRLYLGPLAAVCVAQNGLFTRGVVDMLGSEFGTRVLAGVEAGTEYEAHVVSEKFGTSAKITGVRSGIVPDTIRSRREGRAENYVQVWGTPIGALPG